MFGSASMIATAPCGPTVIPYRRSVGPRGFVGAAARPGSENRTAGGVRSWEKMFAATMASYLGTGGVLVAAASGWASAGTANGGGAGPGTGGGATPTTTPAATTPAPALRRPRTTDPRSMLRPPPRGPA